MYETFVRPKQIESVDDEEMRMRYFYHILNLIL